MAPRQGRYRAGDKHKHPHDPSCLRINRQSKEDSEQIIDWSQLDSIVYLWNETTPDSTVWYEEVLRKEPDNCHGPPVFVTLSWYRCVRWPLRGFHHCALLWNGNGGVRTPIGRSSTESITARTIVQLGAIGSLTYVFRNLRMTIQIRDGKRTLTLSGVVSSNFTNRRNCQH